MAMGNRHNAVAAHANPVNLERIKSLKTLEIQMWEGACPRWRWVSDNSAG